MTQPPAAATHKTSYQMKPKPLNNAHVQKHLSQSINLGKGANSLLHSDAASTNEGSSLQRQGGNYRHTVNLHTLSHMLNGNSGGDIGGPTRPLATNQPSLVTQTRQQFQQLQQASRLEAMIIKSAQVRGPQAQNSFKSTGGRRYSVNDKPSQSLHNRAAAAMATADTPTAMANSFKFNPVALERNAKQVQSSKAAQPKPAGHQKSRGPSNEAGLQRTSALAALSHRSSHAAPVQSKNSQRSSLQNNLVDKISKSIQPNFVIATGTTQAAAAEPGPIVDCSEQAASPSSPANPIPASSPRLREETKEASKVVANETSQTLARHRQNMAQFTSLARHQVTNRRNELPLSSLASNINTQTSRLKVPSEEDSKIVELESEGDMIVGHECSPRKTSAKLVEATNKAEMGCGSDDNIIRIVGASCMEANEAAARIDEKADSATSDHNESESAETLIQQTFVANKADRLIKEFHTESDNEDEIAQANSAVKQVQIEEEASITNPALICTTTADIQIVTPDGDDPGREASASVVERMVEQVLASEAPDLDRQQTISPTPTSLESSQKSSSGAEPQQLSNKNLNVKKSLLTSTGCGPDGSRAQQEITPKFGGGQKIKHKRKVDQTGHISNFSQSLVFNAIERIAKAGVELVVRQQDLNNPIEQLNRNETLYDFDTEQGLEACRRYLECLENLFALSFLKRASREYRQNFTAAYRVLYENSSASPLNYLVEILDSAQESFPFLWVNGKKYEFSQMVLQQGNMMYQTFQELREEISQLHLSVVTAKATMSKEFCQMTPEELLRHRTKIERLLEQFDQDWSIYEKAYVTELMAIEADARKLVTDAIKIVQQLRGYESEQRLRGRILTTSTDEEYNALRNKFLRQISEINKVANSIGQGRDDLDVSVLIVTDEVSRKVSASQSVAVRQLCTHIVRSFNNLRNLFIDRYAENVEVVDPQLTNNPELVHLVARFEKAWCLGRTHLVPRDEREQLISLSQLIEGTCEKYPQFKEQVECSDAEIFLTIPNMLVLKSSLDTGKEAQIATAVMQRFFPTIFLKPDLGSTLNNASNIYNKFAQLKTDLAQQRKKQADKDSYTSYFDFYNKIERQVLFGITQTPSSQQPSTKLSEKTSDLVSQKKSSGSWKLPEHHAACIKEIGMSMTRQQPTEWNEFMIVALGIPADEPLPFLTTAEPAAEEENTANGGGEAANQPNEDGQQPVAVGQDQAAAAQ